MASLKDYLSGQWTGDLPFKFEGIPDAPTPTRLQVLAAFAVMDTGGYGCIDNTGLYGRQGLDMHEAHVWWQMKAYVDGWLAGTDGVDAEWLRWSVVVEHERVKAWMNREKEEGKHDGT